METGTRDLGTQTGAMVDIVSTMEVATLLKVGTETAYHPHHPKKSEDLHGDEMMVGRQDCHQDHHQSIIMTEDPIDQTGTDLAHESLTAHHQEIGEGHRTWTRIYPATAQIVAEEMIGGDEMTAMTVGIMWTGNVTEGWNMMIEVEVP